MANGHGYCETCLLTALQICHDADRGFDNSLFPAVSLMAAAPTLGRPSSQLITIPHEVDGCRGGADWRFACAHPSLFSLADDIITGSLSNC